jgi:hypothetical protein
MKKSEFTQMTQIIEHLVAREVRKQLPKIISEVFQNMMMNKSVITEQRPVDTTNQIEEQTEQDDFKTSLKELFAGTTPNSLPEPELSVGESMSKPTKHYTKNPVLNQILNETTSDLRRREGLVGAAAYHGGYPTVPSMSPTTSEVINSPSIPLSGVPVMTEGQESTHAPLSALPEGISALDVACQVPSPVARALTRNYSQMMKIMDKKKKGMV